MSSATARLKEDFSLRWASGGRAARPSTAAADGSARPIATRAARRRRRAGGVQQMHYAERRRFHQIVAALGARGELSGRRKVLAVAWIAGRKASSLKT
jgi:hypothetical protein